MEYKRYAKPHEIALVLTYLDTPDPRTAKSIALEIKQRSQWVARRLRNARSQGFASSTPRRTDRPALWELTAEGKAWLSRFRAMG